MNGSRIYQVRKSHLVNIPQTLVVRMGNYLQDQRVVDGNKTIDGVVDDLADGGHYCVFVKAKAAKVQRAELKS
jgi:hypothetical protein